MTAMVLGAVMGFDRAVLLAFRQPGDPALPIGPAWLELVMIDLTALGSVTVLTLVSVVAVIYFLLRRQQAKAVLVAVSAVGATLLNMGLKVGIDRPRPDVVAHLVPVDSASFPSSHAMMSAVIYLTLGVLIAETQTETSLKRYAVGLAVVLAGVIGVSRLYLGVHWPSDVVAGWLIGGLWCLVCLGIARRVRRRS